MKLQEYLKLLDKNPPDITLTYEQSHELCEDISKMEISDIPKAYYVDMENFLEERLNSNAVEKNLVVPLEKLLTSLRELISR
ncbi:hypothetical protein G3485_22940 [Shewanella baltica]|uniref:hypothetical protein n=1 Tax=Shewanella baltica TaxID=62322 RepID=UPI000F6FF136|nr:hypothetical protein [Shewanella baltica]VEE61444.1 Uncharacterised protein [Shewanella putrefaciens]MCS6129955.1 hypothetical protein [Shewanella baltica]MCS6141870.1 hypothetical protein [Shewanella baltica]MCS6148223.1 hypothetical protein [Shewanella baltica]MCS6172758.1 hypothetical protein [Shewanella baltica]